MATPVLAPARVDDPVRPAPAPSPPVPADPWRPDRRLGVLAILTSATGMGFAGAFGRLASPPGAVLGEALTMGRMLVGALGMVVVLAFGRRLAFLRRTRLSWSVVLGGVFLGVSLATLLSAGVLIPLAPAVALHYLGPVLAAILARVLRGEVMTRAEGVSLTVSFAGMVLAAGLIGGPGTPPADGDQPLGVLLGVVSGVTYGAALLCYRYRADMPSDVRSFWNFAFGTVATGGLVLVTRPDLSGLTPRHWAWALGFFLVCGLLALSLLVVAGRHLRTAELSGLSYWEVVVALLVGAAVFGEGITPLAAGGAVLIVVGAVLPLTSGRRAVRPAR